MSETLVEYRLGRYAWVDEQGIFLRRATDEEADRHIREQFIEPLSRHYVLFQIGDSVEEIRRIVATRYNIPLDDVKVKTTGGGLLVGPVPE